MRRHRPTTLVLLGALLVAALLCACGGNNAKPPASAVTAAGATQQARASARPTPKPNAASEALVRGLVRFEDLPAGWRLSQDAHGNPEDTDICAANLATLEQERQKLAEASVSFERSSSGPYFTETLATYPTGLAQQVMDALGNAVTGCDQATVRDEEGQPALWHLARIPFPQLGDQTLALREYEPVNAVEGVIVYIRRGDRIAVLLDIAIRAPVDHAQAEAFARKADERLAQLDGGR